MSEDKDKTTAGRIEESVRQKHTQEKEMKNPRINIPSFSGKTEEYDEWKTRITEWSLMEAKYYEYPGLMIKSQLKDEAWRVVDGIDIEILTGTMAIETILKKLDSRYKKDSRLENIKKIMTFYDIKREKDENIRQFFDRFEKARRECRKIETAESKDLIEGWFALLRANLSDIEKQIVLGACIEGNQGYDNVKKEVIRIFETDEKESREEVGWLERGRRPLYKREEKQNPVNKYGKIMRCNKCGSQNHLIKECNEKSKHCWICKSQEHWGIDCPKNWRNQKTEKQNEKPSYEVQSAWMDTFPGSLCSDGSFWGEVEGIIDTGCPKTVLGEK